MEFSVCIDALYMGKDVYASMQEVSACGLKNIEFWTWWDKDIEKIQAEKDKLGLEIKAFCTKFISLVEPNLREEYISGLKETLAAAKKLDCKMIISQTGDDTGRSRKEQHDSLVAGLKQCVPYLEEAGVTLVIEPLNVRVDHPGYYLISSEEAFEVIGEVGSKHVKVLFDIYHQQITEGDIVRHILPEIAKVGHIHAAGNPGRHELANSELNYDYILKEIGKSAYDGVIGLEYFPLSTPRQGLQVLAGLERRGQL